MRIDAPAKIVERFLRIVDTRWATSLLVPKGSDMAHPVDRGAHRVRGRRGDFEKPVRRAEKPASFPVG
jgi:hypothetical protein